MKLLLISIHQQDIEEFKKAPTDISALGVRYLSSHLKSRGHKINLLFLPKPYGQEENREELNQINSLILKLSPDLIGISLMSNNFFRAKAVTKAIKDEINVPIIWGGIHPTIEPENCLNYADLVCVGEGEIALENLLRMRLNKIDDLNIRGIWYKKNNQAVDKGAGPLIQNLGDISYPDYNLADHYIIHDGRLVPMSTDIFKQYYPASAGDHRLISTRGCLHACAYCCNSVFKSMYGGNYLRKRLVDEVIDEMMEARRQFPFVRSFKLMDDSFTANSLDWLKEFSRQYKDKVNLPFFCLVSPTTINQEKIDILIDCGLKIVQMGLQSGSDRINKEIYLRYITSNKFLEVVRMLDKYRDKLELTIDVIIDNPYEKEEDLLKTISVLNQIKRPFRLALYSLAFYPGTELYKRIVKDKILIDNKEYLYKEFHLFRKKYLNKIIFLIPYLSKERVGYFVSKRQRILVKFYLNLLFFVYLNKNKFPFLFLRKIISLIKKKSSRIE